MPRRKGAVKSPWLLVALGAIAVGVIFLSWGPEIDTPEGASAESHSTAVEERSRH